MYIDEILKVCVFARQPRFWARNANFKVLWVSGNSVLAAMILRTTGSIWEHVGSYRRMPQRIPDELCIGRIWKDPLGPIWRTWDSVRDRFFRLCGRPIWAHLSWIPIEDRLEPHQF